MRRCPTLAALMFLAAAAACAAPLAAQPTNVNPANVNPAHANPTHAHPVEVPEWVRPGARLVYETRQAGSGGAEHGRSAFDVLEVTAEGVLMARTDTAQLGTAAGWHFAGGSVVFFDLATIRAGGAPFMPPATLASMQSEGAVVVGRGDAPLHEGAQAVMFTIAGRDRTTHTGRPGSRISGRETSEFITEMSFEPETGIKLHELMRAADSASIRGQNNRPLLTHTSVATGNSLVFLGYRQMDTPWRDQAWMDWTQAVREVTYAGHMRMTDNQYGIRIPRRVTWAIESRQPGLAMGTIAVETQNTESGTMERSPGTTPFAVSRNGVGLWVGPETLASMPIGVIDRDEHLGTTTTFARDQTIGTLTTEFRTGDRIVVVYDLQSGLMLRTETLMREFGMHVELELEGYR